MAALSSFRLQLVGWCFVFSTVLAVFPDPGQCLSIELAGMADASKALTTLPSKTITSDSYIAFGGGILIEGKPISYLSALNTEIGALYFQRMVGYGTLGTNTSTWLEVPLMERVSIGGFSLGAGVYFAKAMGDIQVADSTGTVSTTATFEAMGLNTTDIGWLAGLRYSFWPIPLFFDFRYQASLKNLATDAATTAVDGYQVKFNDFQLLLGVRF